MRIKERLIQILLSIAIIGIPVGGTGVVLYKLASTIVSDLQMSKEAQRKIEEESKAALKALERIKKQAEEEESQQKQMLGCNWYKDRCPANLKQSLNPTYGNDPKVEGEELGLIFIKANIGNLSFGKEVVTNCCKYYYPKTETVVDWGSDYCLWGNIRGDCAPEQAVIAPLGEEDLLCKMEPESPLANTLIKKCMRNATVYYWCCPE